MAIKLKDIYQYFVAATTGYPGGSFKNASTASSQDGTPVEKQWLNDWLGFLDALMTEANLAHSGAPDTAVSSQRLDALKVIINALIAVGNADKVDGYHASKSPDADEIPVLSVLGDLSLGEHAILRKRMGYVTAVNVGMTEQAVLCGSGASGASALAVNAYHDGERWRYSGSGDAKLFYIDNAGTLVYRTAGAGVAEGIITWAGNNIFHAGNYPAAPALIASGSVTGTSASIPLLAGQTHRDYRVSVYSPSVNMWAGYVSGDYWYAVKRRTSGNDTLEIGAAGSNTFYYKVWAQTL